MNHTGPCFRSHVLAGALLAILSVSPAWAAELAVTGDHPFPAPASAKAPAELKADGAYVLVAPDGTRRPAQVDGGRIWWWSDGKTTDAKWRVERSDSAQPEHVKVEKRGEGAIEVTIDGKPFTTLHFEEDAPKPYLWPVIGPTGDPVTRDFPMKDSEEEKSRKRQDHPHHRSVWTAHGDIRTPEHPDRSTDHWASDVVQDGKIVHRGRAGWQKVRRVVRTVSGPVFSLIELEVDWTTNEGKVEFSDTRVYRFFRGDDDQRVFDYQLTFHFPISDVTFADTKEGGLLSVRVAISMDEVNKQGGQMVNSRGQKGMKECWGQPAEWCDYVGPVGEHTLGIAMFDAPTNFRHPTRWHIRDYGLYTANPFMARAVSRDNPDSSHTFKKGETATFNYRVLIHKGDTAAAGIADQYKAYAAGFDAPAK